ncbi:vicilin-like seed storage protein [Iris pallida]|uniref:Vicilin-like seed storage protein n=1 Tax=Iris pallida TaxID=29817 RepID=A0AAX6FBQ8_IRIPA|nr:vicilin-like seed storage protein [Iris pallida]
MTGPRPSSGFSVRRRLWLLGAHRSLRLRSSLRRTSLGPLATCVQHPKPTCRRLVLVVCHSTNANVSNHVVSCWRLAAHSPHFSDVGEKGLN